MTVCAHVKASRRTQLNLAARAAIRERAARDLVAAAAVAKSRGPADLDPMPANASWSAALDNLLLEALRSAWRSCNADFFHGALKAPVLRLDDTRARLGQWHSAERTLSLSRPLVRERSWHIVREVLKHEMAHQFVDEVLGVRDETAHGPAFLRVCADRHIDARANGLRDELGEGSATDADDARVMRRVQKLLALAESDNANEAEAAANAAQRLMLEHNIAARGRGARSYVTRALAAPTFRLATHEKMLAALLAKHFFVEIVFASAYLPDAGRSGSFVEASGTPDNLAMAEWIHGFLLQAAERVCRHQMSIGALTGRDRRRFLAGFMSGVGDKLARESKKNIEAGLVWIGDPDLKAHVRKQHPRLYSTRVYAIVNEAHAQGRAAGNEVIISRPVADAASARGHLLTDAGRASRASARR
jgi:hypothetical protein